MAKIEFQTHKIDVGKKRIDGSRDVIMTTGEDQKINILPIITLEEGNFKVTIEDE